MPPVASSDKRRPRNASESASIQTATSHKSSKSSKSHKSSKTKSSSHSHSAQQSAATFATATTTGTSVATTTPKKEEIRANVFIIAATSDDGTTHGNVFGGLCTNAFLHVMKPIADSSEHFVIPELNLDIDVERPPPAVFTWITLIQKMHEYMKTSLQDTFGPDVPLQEPELSTSKPLSLKEECCIVPPLHSLGTRRALLIGIAYRDSKEYPELVSSHTDVHNMAFFLEQHFEFQACNTIVLMDDDQHVAPTRKNIMNAIKLLVKLTKPGDVVFLHYSGHGKQIKEDWFEKSDEDDGFDEAIVPLDYDTAGFIRDDELRKELVDNMAADVHMSVLMDCCHSGSMLDLPYSYSIRDADENRTEKRLTTKQALRMVGLMTKLAGDTATTAEHIQRIKLVKRAIVQKKADQIKAMEEFQRRKQTKAMSRSVSIAGNVSLITACHEQGFKPTSEDDRAGDATNAFLTTVKEAANKGENLSMVRLLLLMKEKLGGTRRVPQVTSSRQIDMYETFRIVKDPQGIQGTCRALLVGINYATSCTSLPPLKTCQKDCLEVKTFLHEYLGFWDKNCIVLMDDGTHEAPTKENILSAMEKLVNACQPGDSAFFYFAGHGGKHPDTKFGGDEADLMDETVYPCDTDTSGFITDDDIYDLLVCGLRGGVKLTALMDLTQSGTLMDLPYHFNVKDEEVRRYVPATIRVISGRRDQGEGEGNHTGGLCTKAFLAALTMCGPKKTWGQLLTHMRSSMEHQLSQVINMHHPKQLPFISSSRRLRPEDKCEIIPPYFNGTKRALFIGINYAGKGNAIDELESCHMDVNKLKRYLQDAHGLREDHCEVLMDDGKELMPTRENIIKAMQRLIIRSKRGDFLFIHYCGHGGIPTEDGDFDECMVPIDFNTAGVIQEADLQATIVKPVVDGVTMTILLDCCHVGSMLDLPFHFGVNRADKKTRVSQRPSITTLTCLLAGSLTGAKGPSAWCAALNLEDEEVVATRQRRPTS